MDTQEDALKRGEVPVDDSWGYDPRDGVLQILTGEGPVSTVTPNWHGDYRQFYKEFRDAVVLKKANPVSLDDAVLTMELIELACESAKTGCELLLPPATPDANFTPSPSQGEGSDGGTNK